MVKTYSLQNFILVLLLIIIVHISTKAISKKLNKISLEEKWGNSENCYIFNHIRTKNPNDYYRRGGYGFLGKNLATNESVFILVTQGQSREEQIKRNLPYNYYYYSQNSVNSYYLPEKNNQRLSNQMYNYIDWERFYKFKNQYFFAWFATTCNFVRNEGQITPVDKLEIIDENLVFEKDYKKCNYICRTIYLYHGGRCNIFGNLSKCTYLIRK